VTKITFFMLPYPKINLIGDAPELLAFSVQCRTAKQTAVKMSTQHYAARFY